MDESEDTEKPEATNPEPNATDRLTGKAAKPKTAPKAKAKVTAPVEEEAEVEAGIAFRCSVPNDPCLPPLVIRGQTAADAKEKYLAELGVITCGHPVQAAPIE